jgi:outer membrane protein TolC
MIRLTAVCLVAVLVMASPIAAQTPPDVFLRGVPSPGAPTERLALSLADAIQRGLEYNLGAVTAAERVRAADGSRLRARGDVLPRVTGDIRQSDQLVNVAAYGFTGFGGIPPLIGPYTVFDARVAASVPVLDAEAMNRLRSRNASLRAEQFTYQNDRQTVVLVVANLYLEAVADASRVEAARALVATAETLERLAEDQRASGLIAGVEVLRQQVELASARQRLIAAENATAKDKLALARAVGLPATQTLDLTDALPYAPAPAITLEQANAQALETRDDLRAAQARVDAAQAARAAERGSNLPNLHVDADYGALGTNASTSKGTYDIAATVRMPLFQGGAERGKVEQADADLRQREAELADLKAGVGFDLANAFLDLKSADAAVEVARNGEALARQQLDQTQDRFRAGVSSGVELSQAQDALASASDNYISSVYAHNLAKAALARALGVAETQLARYVGGQR